MIYNGYEIKSEPSFPLCGMHEKPHVYEERLKDYTEDKKGLLEKLENGKKN